MDKRYSGLCRLLEEMEKSIEEQESSWPVFDLGKNLEELFRAFGFAKTVSVNNISTSGKTKALIKVFVEHTEADRLEKQLQLVAENNQLTPEDIKTEQSGFHCRGQMIVKYK